MLSQLILKVVKFVTSCNFAKELYTLPNRLRRCVSLKIVFRIVALIYTYVNSFFLKMTRFLGFGFSDLSAHIPISKDINVLVI